MSANLPRRVLHHLRFFYFIPFRAFREYKVFFLSQIGVILRDSNGIAQVKSVTGSKVLRILKKAGIS
jgi:hypothetical protein